MCERFFHASIYPAHFTRKQHFLSGRFGLCETLREIWGQERDVEAPKNG
jgi:hypothetical protein